MPTISTFFGIVIKMFFDEHPRPHFHAEHQGEKAVFDFEETFSTETFGLGRRYD